MNHLKLSAERDRAEFTVPQAQISEDLRAFYDKFRRAWAIARIDGVFSDHGRKIVDAVADLPFADLKLNRELSFPWQRQDSWQVELLSGFKGGYNQPIGLAARSSILVAPERHAEQAKSIADVEVSYSSQYLDVDAINTYLFMQRYHPNKPRELPEDFFEDQLVPKEVTIALHFDPLTSQATTRHSPLQNHHVDGNRYVGINYNFQGINPDRRFGQANTWLWAFKYPRYGRSDFFKDVKIPDRLKSA